MQFELQYSRFVSFISIFQYVDVVLPKVLIRDVQKTCCLRCLHFGICFSISVMMKMKVYAAESVARELIYFTAL